MESFLVVSGICFAAIALISIFVVMSLYFSKPAYDRVPNLETGSDRPFRVVFRASSDDPAVLLSLKRSDVRPDAVYGAQDTFDEPVGTVVLTAEDKEYAPDAFDDLLTASLYDPSAVVCRKGLVGWQTTESAGPVDEAIGERAYRVGSSGKNIIV